VAIEHDDTGTGGDTGDGPRGASGGMGGVDRNIGWDTGWDIDWDAAFEALVAPLRPSRCLRMVRVGAQAIAALVLLAVSCWLMVRVIVEPMRQVGRPWL
jgi:hypothetical protein